MSASRSHFAVASLVLFTALACQAYEGITLGKPGRPKLVDGVPDGPAETFHVHPAGADAVPEGHARGFRAVPWDEVSPGDVVRVHGGADYEEPLVLEDVVGTEDLPVTVEAAAGAAPRIRDSIVIGRSAHLVVRGLTVQGSGHSGIILKQGSHHVTVADNVVRDSALGIWIGNAAGTANRIEDNRVFDNGTHGIAIDRVNCAPGEETVIRGNVIHGNAYHGIELHGSHYVVEGNHVYENGHGIAGTSGIHVFARSADDDAGDHNVIRYNVSHHNVETAGPDGNGIQVDQWCDDNEVHYNLVYGNDGAGINLFDAARTRVRNNTAYGNMRDPGSSHAYRGEVTLASQNADLDRVRGVELSGNLLVATRPGVAAVAVDARTADNGNALGGNLLHHAAGGPLWWWDGRSGRDLGSWNGLAAGGGDDRTGEPRLRAASPASPEDFVPGSGSAALDAAPCWHDRDLRGVALPQGAGCELGALERPVE